MLSFPPGFLWGVATSAHQFEGRNHNTDWWHSEQQGLVPFRSGDACDHLSRYPQDVALVRDLGLNACRVSIEWARIEPEPGRFDQAMLDHYRCVLETLHAAGIEPVVTLHHFTNPLWLAELGSWCHADVDDRFAEYTRRVGERLGDLVRWWVSVNEPNTAGLFGYITGEWPPHKKGDFGGCATHMLASVRGHNLAREVLRAQRADAQVGMAIHLNPLEPLDPDDPASRFAAYAYDWAWQGGLLEAAVPNLDWIGVNYYQRLFVHWDMHPWNVDNRPRFGPGEKTDYGWEIYPEGLYEVLRRVGDYGKPVLVTENGIADADDDQRPRFLVEHLREAHRALQDGVDLRGYLHWSLLDNFEWGHGFAMRFGLVHVEFPTQRRTPRPSAYLYRDIARHNGLTDQMLTNPASTAAALARNALLAPAA